MFLIPLHVTAQFRVQQDSQELQGPDGEIVFRTLGDLFIWLDGKSMATSYSRWLDLDHPVEAGTTVLCTLTEDSDLDREAESLPFMRMFL